MPEYQPRPTFWEDFEVGKEVARRYWLVTPDDIKSCAEGFEDHNPLYYDKEFARGTEWGGIIAPFYMCDAIFRWKSFLDKAGWRHESIAIYTGGDWESFLPIRPGDRLMGVQKVADKFIDKKGRKWLKLRIETFNEAGEMVSTEVHTTIWTERPVVFPTRADYE